MKVEEKSKKNNIENQIEKINRPKTYSLRLTKFIIPW